MFPEALSSASQPLLEPDILDHLREIKRQGATDVVIAPVGFVSDHMEVIYDLDTEARLRCAELGLNMERAATAGTHPKFVKMIRELIVERMDESSAKRVVGIYPANPDVCLVDCCPAPVRPAMPVAATTTA